MSFILYIQKDANISEEELKRIEETHKTPQDEVVRVYTDKVLPNGFAITREDLMVDYIAKQYPELLKDKKVEKIIHEQKKYLNKYDKKLQEK